jgi:hypothetical protein
MRAVYAAHLSFVPGPTLEDVVAVAGSWPCRGAAPPELRTRLDKDRKEYDVQTPTFDGTGTEDHKLAVEFFPSADGRLWEMTWTHVHADDSDLLVVSEVTVCEWKGDLTASVIIRTRWRTPQVSVPRFSFRAPGLTQRLVKEFEVDDAGWRIRNRPWRLDASETDEFVDGLLFDPARTRPVVLVCDDYRTQGLHVDVDLLARELAGSAHVFYTVYGQPGARVTARLGRELGCPNGAMRIWWPKLTPTSDPYRHRLFSASQLTNWSPPGSPVEWLFRTTNVAASTNAAPDAHTQARRASRREAVASVSDRQDLEELLEAQMDESVALAARAKESEASAEEARQEADDYQQRLADAQEEWARKERNYQEALAGMPARSETTATSEFTAVAAPPATVHEAVVRAAEETTHLVFADSAFETAKDSPYFAPDDILQDLLKLDRLAARWARPAGMGGKDLAAVARELGLDWRGGISATLSKTVRRQYEFTHNGEKLTVGPHVCQNHGSGAGRIARIYFVKHEPEDIAQRRFIIGIVGRKRDDSTTG